MSGKIESVSTRQTVAVEVDGRTRFVSAEIRLLWPASATNEEIDTALYRALTVARDRVASRRPQ
ncbi:hypothetical protein SEA_LEGO_34 [Arthrobacter phage Lego]|nr:hypothetical protein SEA_LEGO_34 [Arthrobacter phage Lego]